MKSQAFAVASRAAIAALPLVLFAGPAIPAGKTGSSVSGNWSSGVAVSPALQPDPTRGAQVADIAVNGSGLTVAAWDQYTYNYGGGATIGAAVRNGGKWGSPFTISGASGYSMNPRVAVGADGTIAVSWTYEDPSTGVNPQRKVQVAVRPRGSTAWTTVTLATGSPGGVAVPHFVPVAVDANGNVTAAWTYWDGTHSLMQTATLAFGHDPSQVNNAQSGWSPAATLGPGSTESAMYPDLALDSRGDAGIVYSVSACAGCNMPQVAMYSFRSVATGSWTVPAAVSETMYYVSGPMVALDGTGLATVVYFGAGLEANRQLPAGSCGTNSCWSGPHVILLAPNAVSSYGSYDLGMDDQGHALVAASIFDATIGVDRSSVYVTRSLATGGWTAQQRLTDPTVPIDAYAANVAVSPDGTFAVAGWIDHYHGTVQVAQLSGGTKGAAIPGSWTTSTIGRGTAFSSFQELLILDAGSGTVARALWKNAKTGTQWYASSFGP